VKALVVEFLSAPSVTKAAEQVRARGYPLLDAVTPYPLEPLLRLVGKRPAGVRTPMAVAGFSVAIAFYVLQYWTAVYAYPVNSGGRPLNSWPVFPLVPFEVGVLAAAVAGFAAFLVRCGLPRLNHPFFAAPNTARATQDRFYLLVDPLEDGKTAPLMALLFDAGALSVCETEG